VYVAEGKQDYFGVGFDYPDRLVKGKRWLGDGPYRVWQNRRRGATLGVWQTAFNNTITGWEGWEYPEFKGCFGNVNWMQLETVEGLITAIPHVSGQFVQVYPALQPPAELRARTELSLPQVDLGFLDAIPAIGSKFKPASQSGPQGLKSIGQGETHRAVSFYFGKLP
jgi:hypothetical protein